jgi:hypothetical protein
MEASGTLADSVEDECDALVADHLLQLPGVDLTKPFRQNLREKYVKMVNHM